MARTVLDLDERALDAAMREYHTAAKVETVNRALREVAARREARLKKVLKAFDQASENLAEFDRGEAWRGHA